MKHQLYETGDNDCPKEILDRNGEVALSLCRICGGAESSLPKECPGRKLSGEELDKISDTVAWD